MKIKFIVYNKIHELFFEKTKNNGLVVRYLIGLDVVY